LMILKSFFYLSQSNLCFMQSSKIERTDRGVQKEKLIIETAAEAAQATDWQAAGNEAFQANKFAEAERHYTAALTCNTESRPFTAVCFCNRAAASHAQGHIADAIADCSRAMALDSKYLKAISRRSILHEMIRNYGQAISDLQQLITLQETEQENVKGGSLRRTGSSCNSVQDLKDARERLTKAQDDMKKGIPLDHYLILGVESSSTAAEIKKAYRKAALKHHPDKAVQFLVWSDVGDDELLKECGEEHREDGPHRYYTRRRARLEAGIAGGDRMEYLGERPESPPREEHADPDRDFIRDMAATQRQLLQTMERMSSTLDRLAFDRSHDRHDRRDRSVSVVSGHRDHSRSPSELGSVRGSPRCELRHTHTNDRRATRTADRPMQPNFLPRDDPPEFEVTTGRISDEWRSLPQHVRDVFPLPQYCAQRRDNMRVGQDRRPRAQQNRDLQHVTNKVTLSTFDGSGKISARAWIHKLDTYLTLKPMREQEAIQFATLHLEGVAYDWWHHGLVTQGHELLQSYRDFSERLIARFDRKDVELYYRDLAQLRQSGHVDSYINEF
ncbi:hypothetical protein KI387_041248, partial [Taxus chinensis]